MKNEEIKDSFKAQGLKEAKARLALLKLSDKERQVYESYADDLHQPRLNLSNSAFAEAQP